MTGFVSASSGSPTFGSITASLPPTFSAGDVLLLLAGQLAGSGPVPDLTAQGYTALSLNSTDKACAIYGAIAVGGGSDVAPTINYGVNRNFAFMAAYNGYTLTAARAPVERGTNATSGIFFPAATISTDQQLVIQLGMRNNATSGAHTLGSPPAGFTTRASVLPTTTSTPMAVLMDWLQTTATSLSLSSISSSPADSASQTTQGQIIFLTPVAAAPDALLSWPKQTFVTETIIQF